MKTRWLLDIDLMLCLLLGAVHLLGELGAPALHEVSDTNFLIPAILAMLLVRIVTNMVAAHESYQSSARRRAARLNGKTR